MRERPKIGLALSGGAARGLAHIGVLKALEAESIPIDMIAGTSAGAMVGACYAKERKASILEEIALGIDWKKLTQLVDLHLILVGKGFVRGQTVTSFLSCLTGEVKFKDLEIPLAVVATDVESMEEVVIMEGSVLEALRASISIPVIFCPLEWGGRFLIDGGIVNPMPVDVVRNMGAGVVIAVNVLAISQKTAECGRREEKKDKTKPTKHLASTRLLVVKKKIDSLVRQNRDKIKIFDELSHTAKTKIYTGRGKLDPKTPNIFEVLMQSFHAMQYEKVRLASKSADIVINPDVSRIGTFGFHKAEEAISQGYKATKDILPRLREKIGRP